jgi:hypothetical protein
MPANAINRRIAILPERPLLHTIAAARVFRASSFATYPNPDRGTGVARRVNCAFESTSGVAATMSMLFADTTALLPLQTTIDHAQVATLRAQKNE